jgi:type IX secretion system PorP/SprF family membrane protein
MRLFFSIGWILVLSMPSIAQDIQYSQFYAAPLYLNPAMTGSEENTRVGINYRSQWPGLEYSFNAYSAYYDHFIEGRNSSIGLIVNGSRESLARINNIEIGGLYSYRLRLGESQFLNFGGQLSYVSRNSLFEDLVFGSQIDVDRGIIDGSVPYLPVQESQHRYADLGFGMLWNSKNLWLGASAHHLTRPRLSSLFEENNRLAIKYGLHGGLRLDLSGGFINDYFNNTLQERAVFFAFNYKNQDPFHQLDVGGQIFFEPLILGLWYRGLPIKYNFPNIESIIALVGLALQNGLDVGYSFDVTTSKLGLSNSGGAHELSIRYSFYKGNPYKRESKLLPFF